MKIATIAKLTGEIKAEYYEGCANKIKLASMKGKGGISNAPESG